LKLGGLGNAEDYAELLAGIEGGRLHAAKLERWPARSRGRARRDDVISGSRRSSTQVPDPDCEGFDDPA
jgi:hypothetical protein